jgi:arylsulfatase A-like enzyme
MYPGALGVNQNGNPRFPASHAERLITRRLADAGYDCGLVGKLHLASAAKGREPRVDDGYRWFQYSHSHKGAGAFGHDYAEWLRERGHDPEELLGEQIRPEDYQKGARNSAFGGLIEPTAEWDNIPPELHQTHWCTEKAISFIRKNREHDRPWLLSINPFDPHPPYDPPWEYYRRYEPDTLPGPHLREADLVLQGRIERAGVDFQSQARAIPPDEGARIQAAYYAMIELIDHEFGRLLDFLDRSGQREDTIVIFMSDHGEALGDHGLVLKGCRFYEGLSRVPLLISWPGRYREGEVVDALVELIDLAPTLYEASGETVPGWVQGRSLSALLRGEATQHRGAVRSEFYGAIAYPDQTHATMYRDDRWKLTCYHGKDLYELYDLKADPWEHHNLAGKQENRNLFFDMLRRSFDLTVASHPPDQPRAGPY